ncbi:rnhA, partial [Mucuna pruriens]
MTTRSSKGEKDNRWFLSMDGASNQTGSGAGVILEGSNGVSIEQSLHFEFKANNNQAEYEALLVGMRLAKELKAKTLTAKSYSKLVNGEYQARDPQLMKYLERATRMVATFKKFTLHHVPREQNERVDLLSKLATSQNRRVQRSVIHESWRTWVSLLVVYLRDERLSEDPTEAKRLARDAARYIVIGGELYRRDFSFPLLRCVKGEEARYVIKEVHKGVCDTHIGGRALASKIARADYFTKVDRGRARGHNIGGEDQTFLLEEDNMPFGPPSRDSVQQWDTIRILIDSEFLRPAEDKAAIHIG